MSFPKQYAGVWTLAILCAVPSIAAAQAVRADRPFRGLFGAGEEVEQGQSVSLEWGLLGGYDDNLTADSATPVNPGVVIGGKYASANGALTYAARNRKRSFAASATSSGRYYPDLGELSAFDGGGLVNFASDLGERTKIDLTQSFAYLPYYGINFLGAVVPSEAAVATVGGGSNPSALNARSSYSLDGRAGLTRAFSARSTLRGDFSYRSVRFDGGDETFNWRVANVSWSRNLTRDAALRVGYGYGVGQNTVGIASSIVNHNLDLGIDYNRQLSFSRRTRFNFSTGSTGVVNSGQTTFRLVGNAGITHELGRTWRATGSYNRGIQYLPGFADSFFSDTAQVRVAGLMRRRIEAGAAAGYSSGQLGFAQNAGSYSSLTAGADLRVAMSRTLSFFAEYAYFHYGFDTGIQVPFGLPPQLDRQAVRIGISGWLPLVR